ncbi:MAG: MOSC domain-containing protein, partial [Chloroflexota bacterium]|nr:MOSC domain-containing protein [Chloroflexota bacterium]
MNAIGTVTEIWRYPVKSMRGEALPDAELGGEGLQGDRGWAVVDAATGRVLSAKTEGRLLEASSRLDGSEVEILLPGGRVVRPDDVDVHRALGAWLGRDVRLESAPRSATATFAMPVDAEDEDSPLTEVSCRPGSFFDSATLHLLA